MAQEMVLLRRELSDGLAGRRKEDVKSGAIAAALGGCGTLCLSNFVSFGGKGVQVDVTIILFWLASGKSVNEAEHLGFS